ncbi:MAG TPA: LLM class F420-dependent oxidoreductase [Acidimicrobiales bacterium]|nr:LLM class F420-dependent oxidoreductase [Acidimicrobiales bacterium]
MKLGLSIGNTTVGTAAYMVSVSRAAEELGFDSVWVADHVVWPESYDTPYPYGGDDDKYPGTVDTPAAEAVTSMTWVSAHTSRVAVGSLVLVLPQREPWLLAKQVATLDAMNGGRTVLGVGAGWLREEFDVLHAPFDDRADRMAEMVALLRAVWTEHPVAFGGRFWQAPPVGVLPHPVQRPVPIWIGGDTPAARRRVADYGDGWAAFGLPPEAYRDGWASITRRAADRGRDPGSLTAMLWEPLLFDPAGDADPMVPLHGGAGVLVDRLAAYRDAGVDHFVMFNLAPAEAMVDQLAALAEEVLPAVHDL